MSTAMQSESANITPNKNLTHIGDENYSRFSELLQTRFGLRFPENRRSELEHGMRQAFAVSTCSNLDEYYELLSNPEAGNVEIDLLVNAVTVNETHFFRDEAQFDALHNHILPKLIELKRELRTLRIWSAGCASGEEPYSLAILLKELIPDIENWSIMILATDINTASLDRARQAMYSDWAFREQRAKYFRERYFSKESNRFSLAPEIRRMVTFQKMNLVQPDYPSLKTNTLMMDLILCRNVTIYFSENTTRWIANRLYDALVDGGWLLVGHSEPSIETFQQFQVQNFRNTIAYQRKDQILPTQKTWRPRSMKTGRLAAPQKVPPIPQPAPNRPLYSARKRITRPFPQNTPLITTQPDSKESQDPVTQAQELVEFGRSEEACELLLPIAQNHSGAALPCALLGKAYANLGQWSEAEKWCRQAILRDRLCLDPYYTLALVMQHQEQYDAALELMKKVVYLDHNDVLGHYGLAHLFQMNGMRSQAMKSLANALTILREQSDDTVVPRSQGITAGRLREVIYRQQQAWTINR